MPWWHTFYTMICAAAAATYIHMSDRYINCPHSLLSLFLIACHIILHVYIVCVGRRRPSHLLKTFECISWTRKCVRVYFLYLLLLYSLHSFQPSFSSLCIVFECSVGGHGWGELVLADDAMSVPVARITPKCSMWTVDMKRFRINGYAVMYRKKILYFQAFSMRGAAIHMHIHTHIQTDRHTHIIFT